MNDHRGWETLVAYWAGDLSADEEEATELHLLGCSQCTAESERVAAVTEALRKTKIKGRARNRSVRPWMIGSAGSVVLLGVAAAVFFLVPRGPLSATYTLSAPVRDAVIVEIAPPSSVKEVRLEPQGAAANGVRVRHAGAGSWVASRAVMGPPFAVLLDRAALTPGVYELELVWATPDGAEEPRGFYRFSISPATP